MANTTVIIGTAGMVLILAAFIINLLNKLYSETKTYSFLNLLGGLLLLYYSYSLSSVPFMILQAVWAGFAGYKLIKISICRQHLKNKH